MPSSKTVTGHLTLGKDLGSPGLKEELQQLKRPQRLQQRCGQQPLEKTTSLAWIPVQLGQQLLSARERLAGHKNGVRALRLRGRGYGAPFVCIVGVLGATGC